jgi:hypothetical protein
MRRRGRTDPGRVQRVPLHPRPQHQQNRVHRVPVGHPVPSEEGRASTRSSTFTTRNSSWRR